ncbi:MAG TPA: transposase [Polyangiaceae bacterium]|nr:transposase [Polyangiaceae bacterium]
MHFHAVVLDGVFAPNSQGRQAFYETGAPSHDELEDVVKRIRGRALRWLRKRGLFDDRRAEERSNEAPERSALDACAEVALRGGELGRLEDGFVVPPEDGSEARFEPRCRGPLTAELDGFNMEAAVRIEACDDEGRERLVRYCARPCFALERLSILRDGRVTYQVKYPRRKGTHRVMTPVVFLARLAALVPPPRYPLVRYHGVLAPHAKRRSVVVPKVPGKACKGEHRARADSPGSDDKKPAITSAPERQVPKAQPPGTQEETRNSPLTTASSPAECAASRRGAQEPALEAIWLPQAGLPRTADGRCEKLDFRIAFELPSLNNIGLAAELARRGLGVLLVEYRGYGLSSGRAISEEGLYMDAEAALDALASDGVAPSGTVLWGTSLGSGVAAEMAARGRGAALILVTPFTSIRAVATRIAPILPASLYMGDHYDTFSKAPAIRVPTLIIHGDRDELVPYSMGQALSAAIPGARLITIEGGRHNDLFVRASEMLLDRIVDHSVGR